MNLGPLTIPKENGNALKRKEGEKDSNNNNNKSQILATCADDQTVR